IKLEFGSVLELDEVVYVPSMKKSLISVTRLVKSKFTSLIDGMFRLNCKRTEMEINTVQTKTNEISFKL
ncbi:unnamed protein product, partial [Prunus brigantina]